MIQQSHIVDLVAKLQEALRGKCTIPVESNRGTRSLAGPVQNADNVITDKVSGMHGSRSPSVSDYPNKDVILSCPVANCGHPKVYQKKHPLQKHYNSRMFLSLMESETTEGLAYMVEFRRLLRNQVSILLENQKRSSKSLQTLARIVQDKQGTRRLNDEQQLCLLELTKSLQNAQRQMTQDLAGRELSRKKKGSVAK